MLTLEEMKQRKKELGYTNREISELSGVPFGTVQKIFSGSTERPRFQTMIMLDELLAGPWRDPRSALTRVEYRGTPYQFRRHTEEMRVHETVLAYDAAYEEDLPLQTELPLRKRKKQGEYTVDDYDALPDDRRVELIDGIIYDMAAPTKRHQGLIGAIHNKFYNFLLDHPEKNCEVYLSPVDVQLDADDRTMVQPDLIGLCYHGNSDSRDSDRRRIFGAPDFVMEVLSPSSSSRDCILKLHKYREAGCGEYWIVDAARQRVTVYRFRDPQCRDIPLQYTFDDSIPVAMSEDQLVIDFAQIRRQLHRHFD